MADVTKHNRLSRNFHKTFKPERQYINAMLRYAASGQEGDNQAIAAATGIPTGTSSGKVAPTIDYCRGMGLIQQAGSTRSAVKKPELTPFGRVVLLEDPFLKAGITQWIAHFKLCSPLTGADVWFHTFFEGIHVLGMRFPRQKLESHLSVTYGIEKSGLIGPLIGMYEDDAAFKVCGVLSEINGSITRHPAPIENELAFGYGAWMLQLIFDNFPNRQQVPITDLDTIAGWRTIPGWDISSMLRVLEIIERKGLIDVDRQMEPWLITPKTGPDETWKRIFDDML